MKLFFTGFLLLCCGLIAGAQEHRCGQFEHEQKIRRTYPHARFHEAQERINASIAKVKANPRRSTYTIPVVFHIIHDDGSENVPDVRIDEAIQQLNQNYAAAGSGLEGVVNDFQSRIGNMNVEFRLAHRDPNNKCHKGITRTKSPLTLNATDEIKTLIGWPREKYLNIWVCRTIGVSTGNGIVAGYSYLPPMIDSPWGAGIDGIVIDYRFLTGSTGTLTHEVGHFLGLSHTWGNTENPGGGNNCNYDDGVDDTPNTLGVFGSCDLTQETCGSLDNVQNFMDYASCPVMFTDGQKDVVHGTLESDVADRNNLWSVENLNATGVYEELGLCEAVFKVNQPEVCAGSSVSFTDESFAGVDSWFWEFGTGADPETSTDQHPEVTYTTAGNYDVTLTVYKGQEELSVTQQDAVRVISGEGAPAPYFESFVDMLSLDAAGWSTIQTDGTTNWTLNAAVGREDSDAVYVDNHSIQGGNAVELISPPIDASELTSLDFSFYYAFGKRSGDYDDKLEVYISKDCGKLWSKRKTLLGDNLLTTSGVFFSPFVPQNLDQWKQVVIGSIPETYLVPSFRVKFKFTSGGGSNIYIDDINLSGPVSVPAIDWKASFTCVQDDGQLNVKVKQEAAEPFALHMRNALGQVVTPSYGGDALETSIELPVSSLQAGIYLLILEGKGGRKVQKFYLRP